MRADLLLAASAKLIIVILAYAINNNNFIKNINRCKTISNVLKFIAYILSLLISNSLFFMHIFIDKFI